MGSISRKLTLVFAAGCLGGFANSVAVFLFGYLGITGLFGVTIAPAWTPQWLYGRIVWGGIWGILFFIPLLRGNPLMRGLVLSLGPTIVQLFIVFPFQVNKGLLGLDLGALTPLFVLFFNAVWGVTASYWLRFVGEDA